MAQRTRLYPKKKKEAHRGGKPSKDEVGRAKSGLLKKEQDWQPHKMNTTKGGEKFCRRGKKKSLRWEQERETKNKVLLLKEESAQSG